VVAIHNATWGDSSATATILDDDAAPTVGVSDETVTEGPDFVEATFDVTLSGPSEKTIEVSYATEYGTATVADLRSKSGVLSFSPGQENKTVVVRVKPDTMDEDTEQYGLWLSDPVNVTIAEPLGVGTILDDDPIPLLTIRNVSRVETDSATYATFTVSLSAQSGKAVAVDYATVDLTATLADNDYAAKSGTLTISPGQGSKKITVPIVGDTKVEPDEMFWVSLSNPIHADIAYGWGLCTIVNDDP
jgi:hypothetical protein